MRALVALLVVSLATAVACSRGDRAGEEAAPVPVTVAKVEQKPVPVQVRAIGNVTPTTMVTVRPRINGTVSKIHFREGQDVAVGDLLFTLEARQAQADLRQARANLAKSEAQLTIARKDADRYAELVKQGYISQQQYDQARAAADAAAASARADRAAVENARVEVEYATIRAPLAGRTGAFLVHEGDQVNASTTAMVVINQLKPVDVSFSLPERQLTELQRYRNKEPITVTAVAPASEEPLGQGALTFIDNRVDVATGTIPLKATFPNEQGLLWPGLFVNVVLTLTVDPAAIVVPTAAVQTGQTGRYVFVVRPDQTVESRPVTVAREVGQETVVAQGLTPGETVVMEGQLRLTPGAKVQVAESPPPAPIPPTPSPAAANINGAR